MTLQQIFTMFFQTDSFIFIESLNNIGEVEFFRDVDSYNYKYNLVGDFALRILSCSATEAPCERVFSQLRRIASCHRHRMDPETIIVTFIILNNYLNQF
ncbi:MAG: hypothetical protein EZS28_015543 [Streblomastix strix]|uniref:HAT C-terminal dimerisation domain-containing protein n=1 Tax=Streblomastix strix TaxID=222440 RepID=A0A5J4W320_9EUKA|nr:MAG: hypothetical protein EZS28_015543 [Streblomastix strix]